MYRAFYSLSRKPFTKEIETKHLFPSKSFTELMARLNYLKDSRGIGVVVGEPGAGKTSVLRNFALSLNPSLYKVIYFPLSTGTVMDFYRGLCYGLGEEPTFRKVDLFKQIQEGGFTMNFHDLLKLPYNSWPELEVKIGQLETTK